MRLWRVKTSDDAAGFLIIGEDVYDVLHRLQNRWGNERSAKRSHRDILAIIFEEVVHV